MPSWVVTLPSGQPMTVGGSDERTARANACHRLGAQRLPNGTTVRRAGHGPTEADLATRQADEMADGAASLADPMEE